MNETDIARDLRTIAARGAGEIFEVNRRDSVEMGRAREGSSERSERADTRPATTDLWGGSWLYSSAFPITIQTIQSNDTSLFIEIGECERERATMKAIRAAACGAWVQWLHACSPFGTVSTFYLLY
jgi:hypothetical protein